MSLFRTLLCLLYLCLGTALRSQTPVDSSYATGLIFDDPVYDTLPRQSGADGSKADLPVSVDLSPYCPEVRHQGYIYSCVGWAVGYGAMSIQRAILNQCRDRAVITQNAHSALFLYNQIKTEDCREGARITDAMSFLMDKGDCLARNFDFEVNNCEQKPDSAVSHAAKRFAIQDYLTLFGSTETPAIKVMRVKKVLAAQKPVIIGMSVLRNFYNLKNAQYWHPELGNTAPAGGHALVVVGYDDQREAFRLMNSWGQTWGDGGFIWVKYKDFAQYCKYAFALYLLPPATSVPVAAPAPPSTLPDRPLLSLSGQLEFRAFTGRQEQSRQPQFKTAPVLLSADNVYKIPETRWQIGQLFQLIASAAKSDQYLYVFSVDAARTVHFHWPRQAGLNERFAGQYESALLVAGNSQAIIPGPEKALKLAQAGTDRLVMLVAQKKIDNIQTLAKLVSQKPGDFAQNLRQILGKYAVPSSDVHYFSERIGFEAATRSEGWIVPLILEVETQ